MKVHLFLLLAALLLAACGSPAGPLNAAGPLSAATGPAVENPPPARTAQPPTAGQPTPTLSIADIPSSPTPVIHTATLPPESTPLAAVQPPPNPGGAAVPSYALMSRLFGRPVRGPEGHALGVLAGMVIARGDPAGPQTRYALLDAAPEVGLPADASLVYVPWQMAALGRDPLDGSPQLVLQVEPALLAAAPSFSAASLPAGEPGWDAPLTAYWSRHAASLPVTGPPLPTRTPTPQPNAAAPTATPGPSDPTPQPAAPGHPLLLRGKLADLRLVDADGDPAGSVEDFILHPQNGQPVFVLVNVDERLVPVPLSQIAWRTLPEDGTAGLLQLVLPGELLVNAPAFGSLNEFDSAAPGWDAAAAGYWEPSP